MRTPAQHTGDSGEKMAAKFLEKKGFRIVAQNYRYRRAEVDLIALKENLIVFVEVKTRRSSAFGHPEDFVDKHKAEHILNAADNYVHEHNWQGDVRFDVISILTHPLLDIKHIEDAFY